MSDDTQPTLKPCPFCGSDAELHMWAREVFAMCDLCMARGPAFRSEMYESVMLDPVRIEKAEAQAIAAWNRRAAPGVTVPAPLAT